MGKYFLSAVCAALVGFAAVADETEITLSVTTGATNTIAAALSAYNAAHGTAYTPTTLGTVRIRKTGGGTLSFNTPLAGWDGDLRVDEGVALVSGSYTNGLGNASGTAYVADGATIVLDANVSSRQSGRGIERPIHVRGAGAPGERGALRSVVGTSGDYLRICLPYRLVIESDITWAFDCPGSGTTVVFDNNRLIDMGGHTVTFPSQTSTSKQFSTICFDTIQIQNPGHFVMDGLEVRFRGANFGGDASNTITLRNGAYIVYESGRNAMGQRWKLIAEATTPDNLFAPFVSTETRYNNWLGPVEMKRDLTFATATSVGSAIDFTFFGPVSGSISAVFAPRYYATAGDRQLRIGFAADGNDFTGSLAVTGAVLAVRANHALNGIGGPVTLHDASLHSGNTNFDAFAEGKIVRQDIPSLTFSQKDAAQTVSMKGTEAEPFSFLTNLGTLTQKGPGVLDIQSSIQGGALDLQAGTVRLTTLTRAHQFQLMRGLYAGYEAKANGDTSAGYLYGFGTNAKYTRLYTNKVVRLPEVFNTTNSVTLSAADRIYKTFSGYIWNHGDAPVTYTFACAMHNLFTVDIGDVHMTNETLRTLANGGNNGQVATVTLPPGPTRFVLRYGSQYNSMPNMYAVATNNLANWPLDWGFVYDPQGRGSHDAADYQLLTNDGDLPLFTCCLPDDMAHFDTASSFDVIRGAAGATLDLNGGTVTARAVEGDFTVVNGTINLAPAGSLDRLDLGDHAHATTRATFAGLHHGQRSHNVDGQTKYYSYPFNAIKDLLTNDVALSTDVYYFRTDYPEAGNASAYKASSIGPDWTGMVQMYTSYSGFIWNNSATNETWTIVDTMNVYTKLTVGMTVIERKTLVDGRTIAGENGNTGCPPDERANPGLVQNVTLQPGPNPFTLQSFNRWNSYSCWPGAVITYLDAETPFTNWRPNCGLMVDRLGRGTTDIDNYEPFTDPGDGSLFTTRDDINIAVTTLTANGAAWDLNKIPSTVEHLAGTLAASNGTLMVTGDWTLTPEQIADATAVATGIDFAAGVTLKIAGNVKLDQPATGYCVLSRATAFASLPTLDAAYPFARNWRLETVGDELRMVYVTPMTLIIMR